MAYPSTISAFTNPLSTNRLNAPSHSAIETAQNTDLTAIETFLGVEGAASTLGTLIYDVRSAGSNGGGHIQTANKGGTGQTTYTVGDVLVATSSSVLSKLAVGLDNQVLAANSSVAGGINWVNTSTNKVATSGASSVLSPIGTQAETSIFSVSIPSSALGTTGALRARVFVTNFLFPNSSVLLKANYGGTVISSILVTNDGYTGNPGLERRGTIEVNLINNNSASSQTGNVILDVSIPYFPRSSVITICQPGTSAINSANPNTFGLTGQFSSALGGDNAGLTINGYTIEKIV